eukprot:m.186258 g.186258  ORF g.186258 m.186258 type:complete len:169 (+) comp16697_c3_seq1:403-909(+)
MASEWPEATCDGGDVLTTDNAMFVGVSSRTNEDGFYALRQVFEDLPEFAVIPVVMGTGCLHLKSVITWGGSDLGFIAADSAEGRGAWQVIQDGLQSRFPSDAVPPVHYTAQSCANILRIGDTLYHSQVDGDDLTRLCQAKGVNSVFIDNSEAQKADGALTCCSIVIPQ